MINDFSVLILEEFYNETRNMSELEVNLLIDTLVSDKTITTVSLFGYTFDIFDSNLLEILKAVYGSNSFEYIRHCIDLIAVKLNEQDVLAIVQYDDWDNVEYDALEYLIDRNHVQSIQDMDELYNIDMYESWEDAGYAIALNTGISDELGANDYEELAKEEIKRTATDYVELDNGNLLVWY